MYKLSEFTIFYDIACNGKCVIRCLPRDSSQSRFRWFIARPCAECKLHVDTSRMEYRHIADLYCILARHVHDLCDLYMREEIMWDIQYVHKMHFPTAYIFAREYVLHIYRCYPLTFASKLFLHIASSFRK